MVAFGCKRVMIKIPRLADSTVPAVEGETNRLRDSICMIMPAMLVDVSTRTIAIVRGMRLTNNTIDECTSALPFTRSLNENEYTPITRLMDARMRTPMIARPSRRFG